VSELEELLGFALEALDEVEVIVSRGRPEFAASLRSAESVGVLLDRGRERPQGLRPHREVASSPGAAVATDQISRPDRAPISQPARRRRPLARQHRAGE